MSSNKRFKGKIGEPFVALPRSVIRSEAYIGLSYAAKSLLVDVLDQFRGGNNGDLTVAWKVMQGRGWKSESTLNRAKLELLDAGFLYETRKGARPNKASLYALTWLALNPSTKFDPGAAAAFERSRFRGKVPGINGDIDEMPDARMVNAGIIARMLGVCVRTVHRLADDGRLPEPTIQDDGKALWRLGLVRASQRASAAPSTPDAGAVACERLAPDAVAVECA